VGQAASVWRQAAAAGPGRTTAQHAVICM
jgi:hypothetical protein